MKISAFTIIKDALRLEYPVIESIKSVLPLVDEYLVNVGLSQDGTKELLTKEFGDNPKVKMFDSEWERKEEGTTFFSSQTNKALDRCVNKWCLYLQSDELIHEDDLDKIPKWIDRAEEQGKDGITFKYYHFIKDPWHLRKTYLESGPAYDKEIRLINNQSDLVSFGDGQSFSFLSKGYFDPRGSQPALHQKERFLDSDIYIYHLGWLKSGKKLLEKKKYLKDFYDVSEPSRQEVIPEVNGEYNIEEETMEFKGTHPKGMKGIYGVE